MMVLRGGHISICTRKNVSNNVSVVPGSESGAHAINSTLADPGRVFFLASAASPKVKHCTMQVQDTGCLSTLIGNAQLLHDLKPNSRMLPIVFWVVRGDRIDADVRLRHDVNFHLCKVQLSIPRQSLDDLKPQKMTLNIMASKSCYSWHSSLLPSPLTRLAPLDRDAAHLMGRKRFIISSIAAPEKQADVLEQLYSGSTASVPKGLNKYSSQVTQPKSQGASQAMLYATGLKEDDMDKPQVSD